MEGGGAEFVFVLVCLQTENRMKSNESCSLSTFETRSIFQFGLFGKYLAKMNSKQQLTSQIITNNVSVEVKKVRKRRNWKSVNSDMSKPCEE